MIFWVEIHLKEHLPVYSEREHFPNTGPAPALHVWTYRTRLAQRVIGVFRKERSSPQIRLH